MCQTVSHFSILFLKIHVFALLAARRASAGNKGAVAKRKKSARPTKPKMGRKGAPPVPAALPAAAGAAHAIPAPASEAVARPASAASAIGNAGRTPPKASAPAAHPLAAPPRGSDPAVVAALLATLPAVRRPGHGPERVHELPLLGATIDPGGCGERCDVVLT